jgi:hypothetical protein
MIMVQPDPKAYAAGQWPGIWLLDANTIKHIRHMPDVRAYRSAGVPGPITLTAVEFDSYPKVGN